MEWTVYVLECVDGSLYTGITTDLQKRIKTHTEGKGAKYTKGRGPFILRFSRGSLTRSQALKLEYAIKALSTRDKLKMLENGDLSIVGMDKILSK